MEASKFNDLMQKYGVAFITYAPETPINGRKTTFVVGTTDFDDKHIARIEADNTRKYGEPRPEVAEGEVLIFSYSKDKFRTINLDSIKRVTSMNVEINKNVPRGH
jgi:hypothetical protein